MPVITEELITMSAPNAAAVSNAKKISQKGDFIYLGQSADETLIFGDCKGSGKNPYRTSADFAEPEKPVFRCSCPSRQFPCKHALALLYEFVNGKTFETAEIPADILEKRKKLMQSAEKKKSAAPRQVNQAALAKKMKKQLEGLDLAERFATDLLKTGLAAAGASSIQAYKDLAKQLGDYYLPGPQAIVNGLLLELERMKKSTVEEAACYRRMTGLLEELYATVKKGRAFLSSKLDTQQVGMEDSLLYDRIGYIWQLSQLGELGLVREKAELAQLSFEILFDESRAEYADTGWWVDLQSGEIFKTENLRPLRAVKHLKQDDTVFECVCTPRLYCYPGDQNKRVRWEEAVTRPLKPEDYAAIRGFARPELAPAVKQAKNTIKNTLSEKTVMGLFQFRRIGRKGERFLLEDAAGARIELRDLQGEKELLYRLAYLPKPQLLEGQVLAGQLFYDPADRQIVLRPHSIVTENGIIRLLY